jgi:pyridoxamine 5'-phosphate oxidase
MANPEPTVDSDPAAERPLSDLRTEYEREPLEEARMASDPFGELRTWIQAALAENVPDANAMILATTNRRGQAAARVVLLRDIEAAGLTFYTQYRSRKGRELAENPQAAATFFWASLQRQIRLEGRVHKRDTAVSDAYFQKRPYETQLGAWASQQSAPLAGRHVLDEEMNRLRKRHAPGHVPRPPHWGGYLFVPHHFEFWQGRRHRLNDRVVYQRDDTDTWRMSRLAP